MQIREKDLDGAGFAKLARRAISEVAAKCRVILNDRLDVACAADAAGVHLGRKSIPVSEVRRFVLEHGMSKEFLIGASVHSLEDARAAQQDGAHYVIFGPVFATPSKLLFGEPQGLTRLRELCQALTIPVLAIGGVTVENAEECSASGAAGVAGIRIFQEAADMESLVRALRRG